MATNGESDTKPRELPPIRCPECAAKRVWPPCAVCKGAGKVSRHVFAAWLAKRGGRPR